MEVTGRSVKGPIKRLLSSRGYELRRRSTKPGLRRTIRQSYGQLKHLGFAPATVIDVGVASGTPELYETFPEATYLLVEPLAQFEHEITTILQRYRGSYVIAAAGSRAGEVSFNVHDNHMEGSSLLQETMGPEADGHRVTVPMVVVDDLVRQRSLDGPILLKVDVQGGELEVLEGCADTLKATEAVVLEVSLFEFMKGAPQFYDVVSYMKGRGYVAYDIVLGWNRPLDDALGQVDIVFVKEAGPFRRDHSFATVEQIRQKYGSSELDG